MRAAHELKLAFLACAGLSVVYAAYAALAEEGGGHLFGHGLGLLGAGLMVATETLYSVRKRTGLLRWAGPVRYWLSAHIFTGIVGPFLVLMHTAFEFRGLAGVTAGLTALVVASGFVGRYLYTAIPRTLAGTETSVTDLAAALRQTEAALRALAVEHSPTVGAVVAAEAEPRATGGAGWGLVLLRGWDDWAYQRRVRRRLRFLDRREPGTLRAVERLLVEQHRRARQLQTISAARRLLSAWHTLHVPLGVALFASVAVHVVATLYLGAGRLP